MPELMGDNGAQLLHRQPIEKRQAEKERLAKKEAA
jgi:hypothetical protein